MSLKGRSWIITRAANGRFLTYDLFRSNGFSIDECHYTSDAAVVYTYVHFVLHTSEQALILFLDRMAETEKIMPFEIFGYGSLVTSTTDSILFEHVGFRMLMEHYQHKHPSFKSCTDGREGIIRGVFWNNDCGARIRHILSTRNARVQQYFETLEKEVAACRQHEETIDLLQEEIREYQQQNEKYKDQLREFARFKFMGMVLKNRIESLDPASREMMLKPDHLGRSIFPP